MDFTPQIEKKVSEFKEEVQRKTKECEEFGTEFQGKLEKYFAQNPDVDGIYWTQGTPLWNDGEACVFSVDDVYSAQLFNEERESRADFEGYSEEAYVEDMELGLTYLSYDEEINELLNQNEEFCEFAFGDNSKIFIDRDFNLNISEYEPPY